MEPKFRTVVHRMELGHPPKGPELVLKKESREGLKRVWSIDNAPGKLFYTGLKGDSISEKELIDDLTKCEDIQRKVLKNLLSKEIASFIPSIELFTAFPSVEALKDYIEANHDERLKLLQTYFKKHPTRGQNLINLRKAKEKIDGCFTVETDEAIGNVEQLVCLPNTLKPEEVISIARQILEGMVDLHNAGYEHGNPKNRSCLYFKKDYGIHVKVAGLWKAQLKTEDEQFFKGDVCLVGIQLIQIFEQYVLGDRRKKHPYKEIRYLIEPIEEGFIAPHSGKGKNVEPFVVLDALKYIDEIVKGLKVLNFGKDGALVELGELLDAMTKSKPKDRISMQEALVRFNEIRKKLA